MARHKSSDPVGYSLSVVGDDVRGWAVWLSQAGTVNVLYLGLGATRDEAVERSVALAEWIAVELQQPVAASPQGDGDPRPVSEVRA